MFSLFNKGLPFHRALTNQITIPVFDNSGCFLYCTVFMLMAPILPTRVCALWLVELCGTSIVNTCKSMLRSSWQYLCPTWIFGLEFSSLPK